MVGLAARAGLRLPAWPAAQILHLRLGKYCSPMHPFNKDHPHVRSPKGVMGCDEIRHWLSVLHQQFGWPWETLARTLGIGEGKHVASKVRGNSWIYPGEQIRMSRQLDRILSGELVCEQCGRRVDAVLADSPTPLANKPRLVYDLNASGMRWVAPRLALKPALPSFRAALGEIKKERPES